MALFSNNTKTIIFYLAIFFILLGAYKAIFSTVEGAKGKAKRKKARSKKRKSNKKARRKLKRTKKRRRRRRKKKGKKTKGAKEASDPLSPVTSNEAAAALSGGGGTPVPSHSNKAGAPIARDPSNEFSGDGKVDPKAAEKMLQGMNRSGPDGRTPSKPT